ncbi:G patch domain-containing protein 4 isoform X2 [Python bivittatus]|uniref:G patch domain-containing protein 4 n=1 Tax=Python bivittatus TaxID=176946 RepID=A0A9F5IYW7_PYTBI|nr:G patch domain-containing protein 4 isoform X2 [Python bivittatus]
MKGVSLEEEKKKKKRKKKKVAVMTTSKGLKFAKKQLKKHGWKKGKGLGKQENGISEALKVKVKCNTAGDGIQVRKVSEQDGPVTSKKLRRAQEGNMLYGRFVKAATLISGTEEPVNPTSSSDQEEEKMDLSTVRRLTDEELFQACGGRTVHKGARHGLTMGAKLARLEEQEKAFLASCVQQKEGPKTAPSKRSKVVGAAKKSQTGGACIKAKPKKKNKKKNAKEMNRH